MAYTGTQLLNMYCRNLAGTYSGDELQSFIDQEGGNIKLAQAAIYEAEASSPMFPFSAGDSSVDKSRYAANLLTAASQIRKDAMAYPAELSSTVSWSGSAESGTQEVQDWIDTDDRKPTW